MTSPEPADERASKVTQRLLETDATMAADIARHAGDKVFETVRMHAMTMPTTGGAILLGCLIAHQVLTETIEFAARSMDGDEDDAAMMRTATLDLFRHLLANPEGSPDER